MPSAFNSGSEIFQTPPSQQAPFYLAFIYIYICVYARNVAPRCKHRYFATLTLSQERERGMRALAQIPESTYECAVSGTRLETRRDCRREPALSHYRRKRVSFTRSPGLLSARARARSKRDLLSLSLLSRARLMNDLHRAPSDRRQLSHREEGQGGEGRSTGARRLGPYAGCLPLALVPFRCVSPAGKAKGASVPRCEP